MSRDWGIRPLAKESKEKRRESFRRVLTEAREIVGRSDFRGGLVAVCGDGAWRGLGLRPSEDSSSLSDRRPDASVSASSSSTTCSYCCAGGSGSQLALSMTDRLNLTRPKAAYKAKITRYAPMSVQLARDTSASIIHPQTIVPLAVPAVPIRIYQVKISLRISAGVSCESVDSSTALKGPISLPLTRT